MAIFTIWGFLTTMRLCHRLKLTDSIRLPKMTRILTKITDQNKPFYINANYEDNEIEIVILQNSKAWKCSVTEGILNEWSKKHQKSFTDYFGTLKEYLNSPPEGVSLCLNNNEFVVYRSLNKGRTKFISINLEEIDYVGVVEETLVKFYDENRNYRNKIEELETQQKILDQSNAEYLGKLQEFIERKERDDEQLYSNFVQLLNEKKRKIQHLTELLEGFRNWRSTENPAVETKRRKRKKDDETPETSTNQRKEVLSESEESNYESEEEMEQEQTSSSDDSDRNVAVESHDSKMDDDFVLPKRIINTEIKPVEVRVANSPTVEDVEPEIVENKRRKPNLDDTQELLDAI